MGRLRRAALHLPTRRSERGPLCFHHGLLALHFSPIFYCGGGSGHVYCVALGRAPRHTVVYVCGALGRVPCIHARLRRLATKTGEKCGLGEQLAVNMLVFRSEYIKHHTFYG